MSPQDGGNGREVSGDWWKMSRSFNDVWVLLRPTVEQRVSNKADAGWRWWQSGDQKL